MVTETKHSLLPSDFCIVTKPAILETLVGSCVAVCLYNYKYRIAAMNHFLRDRPAGDCGANMGEFGSTSTRHIISKLLAIDGAASHYKAMVYGGAAVVRATGGGSDVGRRNVEVALEVLAEARIRVVEKQVLGTRGRRVTFYTADGTVKWRYAGDIPGKVRG